MPKQNGRINVQRMAMYLVEKEKNGSINVQRMAMYLVEEEKKNTLSSSVGCNFRDISSPT